MQYIICSNNFMKSKFAVRNKVLKIFAQYGVTRSDPLSWNNIKIQIIMMANGKYISNFWRTYLFLFAEPPITNF